MQVQVLFEGWLRLESRAAGQVACERRDRRLQCGELRLEEAVILADLERVEDVEVEPLGEDERVVEQVGQRGRVGEEVPAVGFAQQRVLVVAEDGRGQRVEGHLYMRVTQGT